jgi:hypothetical protein
MTQNFPYTTHLDIRYPALAVVDVPALIDAVTDKWYNQTLCKVNDSVVRLGVMQGEYHWHKHDDLDEFFYVVEGKFLIDLEGRSGGAERAPGIRCPEGSGASDAGAAARGHPHGRGRGNRPDGRLAFNHN